MATGLVSPEGVPGFTQGIVPTIQRVAPGQYSVSISGLGTGCLVPQLGSYFGGNIVVTFGGGSCGPGSFNSTVFTSDGQDHYWTYMFIGVGGSSSSSLRSSTERLKLPGRRAVRTTKSARKGR